jgi:hypothetical protein
VDADNAVRASFPPDGYRLAESLVSANRFSWTTAIAARTVFQVSRSPDFHSLIHEEAPGAPSCCGRAWPCGRYFWRLRTLNTDDSVLMDSPPRSFEVVAPLPGPALLKPAPSGTCLLRENDQATLSWTAVEGADSYELALRPADADDAPPLLQHTVSGGTSLSWPLGDLPSGAYRLSLQAVASAGAGSTRLPGRTVTSVFNIACIPYIRLEGPSRGEHLDGLAARRGGAVFRYRLGDRTENASLVLSSETTGARIGSWKADRSGRTAVRRLDPGAYAWTVTGAADGFDVSARESQRFVVDPPEPLPAPALTAPEPDRVFGPEQLRAKRSITFAWTPVRGATAYRLAIFQPGRKDALFVREKITATSFTLEDLASLDKGGFSWAVQAQSWDERGELEQPGREARSGFTIDLPSVRKPKPDSGKKLYGK